MKSTALRSPLFYVGDKYKIIKKISQYFPKYINNFIEPFVGGGSVFMNINANNFLLNDIDTNIIELHLLLSEAALDKEIFIKKLENIIEDYNLSYSFKEDKIPQEIKKQFKKTYFAKYNKEAYDRLKTDFNNNSIKNYYYLYILLIYGFNRMLRFNKNGIFNLPVGNVDFNKNVHNALNDYFEQINKKKPNWYNYDYKKFIYNIDIDTNDFIYLDPPYLITFSEYNKIWNEKNEIELLNILEDLDRSNVKFAISNIINYKGRINKIFRDWAKKYNTHNIKSNYISYHDNSIKNFTEVLITNY